MVRVDEGGLRATAATGQAAPAEPERVAVVPEWLAVLASLAWRVVAVTALLVVLWVVASLLWTVTAAIAVSVVISAVFAPWVVALRHRGRSRNGAAGIVWAGAMLALAAIGLVLALAFLPYLGQVIASISAAVDRVQAELAAAPVLDAAWSSVGALVQGSERAVEGIVGRVAAEIAGIVTVLVLATFLVFFFLRDGDRAWYWLFQGFPDAKQERITSAGRVALARIGGYLRGTTILSAVIALTDLVFMLVLGVPLAVPLSILVFLSGYIPYFGGIVTTAIVLLVTYASLGTWPVVVMLFLIAARNVILGYGLRPAVLGRTTSVHPALVLIVLPAGYAIAGVIGLFVAVPVAAVLMALREAVLSVLAPEPPPVLPGLIPAWLDRAAQWSWRLLAAFALVALLVLVVVSIPVVSMPIMLATILAATLLPLVRALVRRGRSRTGAAALAVGGGFLAVVAVLALALVALVDQAAALAAGATQGATSADTAAGGHLGLLRDLAETGGTTVVQAAVTVGEGLASLAVIVVLSCLLAFYFLRDGAALADGAFTRMGTASAPLRPALEEAFDVLGGYMSGTAIISLVGAASQLAIMLLFGIPLAVPVFVLSFFLCFIPYIGGFISTGIAFLLTVAFGTPEQIVLMGIYTIVFNIVTGNIVSPIVYGKTVHLHPAVVLVAIPAGAAVAGILGMFLVVPVLGVIAVLWRPVVAVMNEQAAPVGARSAELEDRHGDRGAEPDHEGEAGLAPAVLE